MNVRPQEPGDTAPTGSAECLETTGLQALPTWRGVYYLVLAWFAVCVALLAWLSRAFS